MEHPAGSQQSMVRESSHAAEECAGSSESSRAAEECARSSDVTYQHATKQ
jgi:hypothetical protein